MTFEPENKASEARTSHRRRTLKAGVIAFQAHFITYKCTVKDVSETGAKLRLDDTMRIPDHFDLVIELDGVEHSCEVVWRRPGELGVRFVGEPRRKAPTRAQIVSAVRPDQKATLRRKT